MSQAGVLRLRFSRRCSIGALFALLALALLGGAPPAGAATGGISTVAGSGFGGSWGDGGLATSAAMGRPMGVAFAPDGTMYIADVDNHVIRKVSPFGLISTYAG